MVTNLTEQKRSSRINVHIDGKYYCSLTIDQLLDNKISIGKEIEPERLKGFKQLEVDGKVMESCVRWGSMRPRSQFEFKQYSYKKGFSEDVSAMALEKLEKLGYVDDKRVAEMMLESRSNSKPASKRELQAQLSAKGIRGAVVDELLSDFKSTELSNLQQLIEKKRKLSRFSEDNKKLTEYLVRKGYRYSDVVELLG